MLRRISPLPSGLSAGLLQVRARSFELGAAELGVGVGADRRFAGGGELDGAPDAAAPGAPATERDALGEQQHAVLGAVFEREQRAGGQLEHPLDRHLHGADLGAQQHVGAGDAATQGDGAARVASRWADCRRRGCAR